MREGAGRRLLHREDLHPHVADREMGSMAFDRRVGDEVVDVSVVLECGSRVINAAVHEAAEESERVGLA